MSSLVGFIVTRCITSEITNNYWQLCYDKIREYFPDNPIVIIDDSVHQRPDLISDKVLINTTIIQSEYPGRGELLPYIYYLKYAWFPKAVILNDCVFINSQIDITFDKYKMIWSFNYPHDNVQEEMSFLSQLANPEKLIELYQDQSKWEGCFASMSMISIEYLHELDQYHDLKRLIDMVKTRTNRCSLERVMGCLLQTYSPKTVLLGSIRTYGIWGITWDQKQYYSHLPVIRVWTGR